MAMRLLQYWMNETSTGGSQQKKTGSRCLTLTFAEPVNPDRNTFPERACLFWKKSIATFPLESASIYWA